MQAEKQALAIQEQELETIEQTIASQQEQQLELERASYTPNPKRLPPIS